MQHYPKEHFKIGAGMRRAFVKPAWLWNPRTGHWHLSVIYNTKRNGRVIKCVKFIMQDGMLVRV